LGRQALPDEWSNLSGDFFNISSCADSAMSAQKFRRDRNSRGRRGVDYFYSLFKAEFGFEKRQVVFRMTIDRLDPAQRVVMRCHGDHPEWNNTTLSWDLVKSESDKRPTTLRFTHSGWRELSDYCIGCNSMWGNLMFRLKDAAEGNGRGPQWKE
jgi:hypothetical protein